ncbi:MAG: response regulator [Verrucomicrobia bacterium]|nr:response regulator [Verrucomicrobiota bacterium]
MEAPVVNHKWNAWHQTNRLKFALVVDEADRLRTSVITILREHGWLVHAVTRAEHAFGILAHIPYSLIVLDSELPGLCAADFVRILRKPNYWQAIQLVVINSSASANVTAQLKEAGAFLARRSKWEDDLKVFLSTNERDSRISVKCSRIAGQALDSGADQSDFYESVSPNSQLAS